MWAARTPLSLAPPLPDNMVALAFGAVTDLLVRPRREAHDAPIACPPSGFGYRRRPALAGITGGRRWWTVSTISLVSIPWR